MTTSILDKPFFTLPQFSGKEKTLSLKRQYRIDFDQPVPSDERIFERKNSDHMLDSLSEINNNQTLSPEQLAKSKVKLIEEKFSSLAKIYEIHNAEEIKNFLSKNQFLFPLLEEIQLEIPQFFENGQKLSLIVSHEPDFPQSSELRVFILTKFSAKEAFSSLEKFDKEWWLENISRAQCKLSISLEYI